MSCPSPFSSTLTTSNMIISPSSAGAGTAFSTAAPPSNYWNFFPHSPAPRLSNRLNMKRIRNQRILCRAELAHDAPFAAAIGACFLTSLAFPIYSVGEEDEDGGGAIDSTDARFAVMAIIGFIPYFNWLSWIFAWLDTSRPRYLVYSMVYLAPYLRTNLSLSPEESWLPITSILICIFHIQLEASLRNGDLNGSSFFSRILKLASPFIGKKGSINGDHKLYEGRNENHVGLPTADEEPQDRFPTRQFEGLHHNEGSDELRKRKSD